MPAGLPLECRIRPAARVLQLFGHPAPSMNAETALLLARDDFVAARLARPARDPALVDARRSPLGESFD
jgi:hypothetical protein